MTRINTDKKDKEKERKTEHQAAPACHFGGLLAVFLSSSTFALFYLCLSVSSVVNSSSLLFSVVAPQLRL
jgi:hypothetical protein